MSKPPRKNLRDRNAAAIAGPDISSTSVEHVDVPAEPSAPTAKTTPKAPALPSDMARIGIYFHPDQFDTAKAAYLADWQAGGDADTFGRWIAQALDEHAARTPAQRGQLTQPQERAATRGNTRSFSIPANTVARMRESITADQQHGRWPSDSAWCGEAITAAVNQARRRAGGSLPTPPARLPNRLAR